MMTRSLGKTKNLALTLQILTLQILTLQILTRKDPRKHPTQRHQKQRHPTQRHQKQRHPTQRHPTQRHQKQRPWTVLRPRSKTRLPRERQRRSRLLKPVLCRQGRRLMWLTVFVEPVLSKQKLTSVSKNGKSVPSVRHSWCSGCVIPLVTVTVPVTRLLSSVPCLRSKI